MCLGMCKYIYVMQVQKCKFEGFFLRIPEILKLDRNALNFRKLKDLKKGGVFNHHNSTPIKIDENSQSQGPKIDVYQIPHPKYVQKLPYIRKIFNEIAIPLHNF